MIETSGHDRLRAAADRLDGNAGAPGISVKQMNTEAATAALLRAVAKVLEQEPPINWLYPVVELDAAARALADTILGVDDE